MQRFTSLDDFSVEMQDGNVIIGAPVEMMDAKVEFKGKNNIMFFDDNVKLYQSSLRFLGDNNVIFVCSSEKHIIRLNVDAYNNSVFYIGKDANTTRPIHVALSEGKNVVIGDTSLFSFGTWFRNSDPHLIYDAKTGKRINESKSVYLGDHVWVGQDVLISKGTKVGSGTIIGAKALTGGKTFPSNCSIGGVPCKVIKKDIFWLKPAVHFYTPEDTQNSLEYDKDTYIYSQDSNQLSFDTIEDEIQKAITSAEKLEVLKKYLFNNNDKNRFFIPDNTENTKPKRKSLFKK